MAESSSEVFQWSNLAGYYNPIVKPMLSIPTMRLFRVMRVYMDTSLDVTKDERVTRYDIATDSAGSCIRFLTGDDSGYALRTSDWQLYHWSDEPYEDKHQIAECTVLLNQAMTLIRLVSDQQEIMYNKSSWIKWRPAQPVISRFAIMMPWLTQKERALMRATCRSLSGRSQV